MDETTEGKGLRLECLKLALSHAGRAELVLPIAREFWAFVHDGAITTADPADGSSAS